MRKNLSALVVVAAIALAGCGAGSGDGGAPAPSASTTQRVTTTVPRSTTTTTEEGRRRALAEVDAEIKRVCFGVVNFDIPPTLEWKDQWTPYASYSDSANRMRRCVDIERPKKKARDEEAARLKREQEKAAEEAAEKKRQEEAAAAIERGIAAKATMEEFNRIATGMTLAEVQSIIGSPGELSQSTEYAGIRDDIYQWDGIGDFAFVIVSFEDGRVTGKSQVGL